MNCYTNLKLIDQEPPWHSPARPKPVYKNSDAQAYWDVPVFAERNEVTSNRVDASTVNHKSRSIIALEMSCSWVGNRGMKYEEKTVKYGSLRWELKQQYVWYSVEQYNIIMDVLGGCSTEMEASLTKLLGAKCAEVLRKMQQSVICSSLNIARTFKVAI